MKNIPKYNKKELKKKLNEFCLCIPIYNEGDRILKELTKANKVSLYNKIDIILIDGGSNDGSTTQKNLEKYNVNTIIEMYEKGIYKQSQALQAGFHFAIQRKYIGVITVDGNNKDKIEQTTDFIEKLQVGYDYIQGSRFIERWKKCKYSINKKICN